MDICLATDDNYVKYLATVITSIIKNNNIGNLNFHIIHGGLKKDNLDFLRNLGNIKFHLVDDNYFAKYLVTEGRKLLWPTPTLYRLKAASILEDVDKVLYLDCDVVVRGDISEFENLSMDSYYIAAVPDISHENNGKRLGIPIDSEHFYFNAGVVYLNLKKIREDDIESKLLSYLENNYEHLKFNDQDVLNYILQDNVLKLDNIYNHIPIGGITYNAAREKYNKEAKIVHFAGTKPWDTSPYVNLYEKEFWEYLEDSNALSNKEYNKMHGKYLNSKTKFSRIMKYLALYPTAMFLSNKRKDLCKILFE